MSSVEETTNAGTVNGNGAAAADDTMPVVRVSVPKRSAKSEFRAIKIVWRREIIRFRSDRLRIITSLVQPFLFLFVLGSGLQEIASAGTHGVNLKTFMYPGILCVTVMFTAMFSAASIVWDREFGFLREMMVAPVRRSSLVIGKVLGGATVACFQGVIVMAIAPLVHVPYAPLMLLGLFGIMVLLALAVTAFGVMIAARIKQMQSFMAIMQMIITPLYFVSGALFPAQGLPAWLEILNRFDPIAYAVDPMRRLVFQHIPSSPLAKEELARGITWFGWRVPSLLEVAMIAIIGAVLLAIAIWEFSTSE
jgi:ABC-2 type transport system permease protein